MASPASSAPSPYFRGLPPVKTACVLPHVTLARPAKVDGPGLFTGQPVRLSLHPAEPGSGLRFVRNGTSLPASIEHVDCQPRHTVLSGEGLRVETVEHLLAALAGLGVTDVEIEVDRPLDSGENPVDNGENDGESLNGHAESVDESFEMPMGDGSAQTFVDAVKAAGLQATEGALEPLRVAKPVYLESEDGRASLVALPGPADALEIVYTFDGPAPVGRQVCSFRLEYGQRGEAAFDGNFDRDLAAARTFIFATEAEALKQLGWGGHLTYDSLLVIGEEGPIDNAFRWPDEPVRHKVLDLIGDLALVGRPVCGRIVAHRSGHDLNHRLARALLEADAEPAARENPAKEAARPAASTPPPAPPDPVAAGFGHLLGKSSDQATLDVRKIQRILPHRFPMLLVDRVLEIDGDRRAVGLKNITMGDVFFLGHYPGAPIFPGVLIVEAMGQLGGILLSRKLEHTGKIAVLLSMDGVKMRQPVTPGDQLVLVAEAVRVKSRTGHVRCQAFVADKLAAEADIKFMLVDADKE